MTLIAGFTQASMYFEEGTPLRSKPFEDETAFLANITNRKYFPYKMPVKQGS
jgi:hypothetical protein